MAVAANQDGVNSAGAIQLGAALRTEDQVSGVSRLIAPQGHSDTQLPQSLQ
jgi:hypothetical protein